LAPLVIKQIGDVICMLKDNLTVFLAEQNFNMALSVADYIYEPFLCVPVILCLTGSAKCDIIKGE